eukprot:4708160-Ditylum_brightwellii.AAC.1
MEEIIHIKIPWGYQKDGYVLRLKRSLCWLRQSLCNFFESLKSILMKEHIQMQQSKSNLCMFYTDKAICLVHVDDFLFFAKDDADIDAVLKQIKKCGLEMTIEDDVAGFLGVLIKQVGDKIHLPQEGMIDKIKAMGLEEAKHVTISAAFNCL